MFLTAALGALWVDLGGLVEETIVSIEVRTVQHGFPWSVGNAALCERTSIYGSMAGICSITLDRVSVVRPYASANPFLASLK